MQRFYSFLGFLYSLLIKLAVPFNYKARMMQRGRWHLWSKLRAELDPDTRYIWFHAASLGEFEQGRPMMELLRKRYPDKKILLSFFSPSGYEVRKNYEGADIVCYLPADRLGRVRKFLNLVNPELAIFIKYDFWPCFLLELERRQIPTYLISAIFRPEQLFFKPFGRPYLRLLRCFEHLFVQNEESVALLRRHGVEHVTLSGDTRFDRVLAISKQDFNHPVLEAFAQSVDSSQYVFIAGSSWPNDEEIIVPYFNRHSEMKLILAPHEISKERILQLISYIRRPFQLLSEASVESVSSCDCLIVDSFGLLSSLYRFADIAYIGGGFGRGIHNTLEAAVYGLPVIFGPRYEKFQEAKDLIAHAAAHCIDSDKAFAELLAQLDPDSDYYKATSEAAMRYVEGNLGGSEIIFEQLFGHLQSASTHRHESTQ